MGCALSTVKLKVFFFYPVLFAEMKDQVLGFNYFDNIELGGLYLYQNCLSSMKVAFRYIISL